jgi:uncharacterized protein involved in exopolysaccharide biosynthesis
MIGQRELKLEDYLAIARRHRLLLIVPALLGAVLVYGISLTIPYQYLSQTLVLVKQPAVPRQRSETDRKRGPEPASGDHEAADSEPHEAGADHSGFRTV